MVFSRFLVCAYPQKPQNIHMLACHMLAYRGNPELTPFCLESSVYGVLSIMLLRDSIIYSNVVLVVCKNAGITRRTYTEKKMRLTQKLQTLLRSTERESITYHKCNADIDDCIKDLMKYDTVEQSIILQELRIGRMISMSVLAEFDKIAKHVLSDREYRYYRQRSAIMISPLLLINE